MTDKVIIAERLVNSFDVHVDRISRDVQIVTEPKNNEVTIAVESNQKTVNLVVERTSREVTVTNEQTVRNVNVIVDRGPKGETGPEGKTAYEVAVENGFVGTESAWLESLKGLSAYQIAVSLGYLGTESEWLLSLKGEKGDTGAPGSTRPSQLILRAEKTIVVGQDDGRMYNASGQDMTISKVFMSVSSPPTGSDIIIDIYKNGTTIFTNQANRPRILASSYTGEVTVIDVPLWESGAYLTWGIIQVGSGSAGSDLTAQLNFL